MEDEEDEEGGESQNASADQNGLERTSQGEAETEAEGLGEDVEQSTEEHLESEEALELS